MSSVENAHDCVVREMLKAELEDRVHACERGAVLVFLRNLMTFPRVKERVEQRMTTLHGWYFDIESGEMLSYTPDTKVFELL